MRQTALRNIDVRKFVEADELVQVCTLPRQVGNLPYIPVPGRYAMPPPHLPADAPVLNVLQPLRVNFFPMRRIEPNQVFAHDRKRFFRLRIPQKPLLADPRLDWTSLRSLKATLFS